MLTAREEELKAAYIQARGYWNAWTEGMLRLNPDFLERYAAYGGHPAANGPLSPVLCELLYVALDASGTHLFEPGLKLHMRIALDRGATPRQLMQVLQLATAQGLDGTAMGVAILDEELTAIGQPTERAPWTAEQAALRSAYEARFGDWPRHCDLLLRWDPGYFAVMLDLLTCPGDTLDPVSAALIALALAACFTASDPDATRLHIRRALRLGADRAAILQVLQMTAHLGVHACSVGIPALMEVMDPA